MPRSIAVLGGGIAGLAAAYELNKLQQAGADIAFTLIEASDRLGGILETHREQGFIIECGPDAWVTEKPWAREIAEELGMGDDVLPSRDDQRITYVLQHGKLVPMPQGMRMMVPADLRTIQDSPLFSAAARQAYADELQCADELKLTAPAHDESVASFVQRHFGEEVLRVVGAPLLGGVFGGDVHRLSVQAVMQPFVKMEREHGSLIAALQARAARPQTATFTSLRHGTAALSEAMSATLPPSAVRLQTSVTALARTGQQWAVTTHTAGHEDTQTFDAVLCALPIGTAQQLLRPLDADAAALMQMPTSSAVIVAFGFLSSVGIDWPAGFGFLAPEGENSRLLAATFADQKFDHRVPAGGKLIRAYFGGVTADDLIPMTDKQVADLARVELEAVLGTMPRAAVTVVRRWPNALPQYNVGHLERMAALQARMDTLLGLHLLGNGYRGVGLPDLVRDARAVAHTVTDAAAPVAA